MTITIQQIDRYKPFISLKYNYSVRLITIIFNPRSLREISISGETVINPFLQTDVI
jgi:hypothetical protein